MMTKQGENPKSDSIMPLKVKEPTIPIVNAYNVNLEQYKHFFEENYFPVSGESPIGYIISSTEGHNVVTIRDKIYAASDDENKNQFSKGTYLISNIEKAIYATKEKKKVIGKLLNPTGEAVWIKNNGDLAILEVTKNFEPIMAGSLLIPMSEVAAPIPEYAFTTTADISGKVSYILNDRYTANEYSSVMLDIGTNDGIKNGMIVYIYKKSSKYKDPRKPGREIDIPGSLVATAVVYRSSAKLSIALIINDIKEVLQGYEVSTHER